MRGWLPLVLLLAWVAVEVGPAQIRSAPSKRISFHNRLLLNRAAVVGLSRVQILLLTLAGQVGETSEDVERLRGHVKYADEDVGYIRAEVPIEVVLALIADPQIVAYQITSLSRAAWYRDTPPRSNAEMFRGFEVAGVAAADAGSLDLPELPAGASRAPEFTAEAEMGLAEWFRSHPTFDGRGVTIGFLENAQPDFSHAIFNAAGGSKLAGILTAVDPDDPDDTRVELDLEVRASSTWTRIGSRTCILPRPGRFRFGSFDLPAGANLLHRFGVLRDPATGETWVDTNGNASFQDESPIADVNQRIDVRALILRHPDSRTLPFVLSQGRRPNTVHIYTGRGDHQTMTVSVAAGSKTADNLAVGVAPGARVFLIRTDTNDYRLHHIFEGYLEAARHPGIDLLAAATGFELVPDTDADFAGLFFSRLIQRWQKPIFQSAGNRQRWLGTVNSLGEVFSVGGTLSPEAFAAFYGGGQLKTLIVHPSSAAGPAIDGRLKPDFLAPTHRIAAALPARPRLALPRNAPSHQLPSGYQISCCTSASSQFAAGLTALLLSGIRQERIPYSYRRLSYALRTGSRFLPGTPAHQQGNGVLNVNDAWHRLAPGFEPPSITAMADVNHPLADYAARGSHGVGLFEWTGWSAGARGRRELRLVRHSGSDEQATYHVSWLGNDGTFSSPAVVSLGLNTPTILPIEINPRSSGAHSAILNLHDAAGRLTFRTQATVIAAERAPEESGTLRFTGSVSLLGHRAHYVEVPAGFDSLSLDLEVLRGAATVSIIPGHGLFPAYQGHAHPQNGRTFTAGRYTVALPYPSPGTWTIDVANTSIRRERNPALVSNDIVEYTLTMRLQRSALIVRRAGNTVSLSVQNRGAELRDPVALTSAAEIRTRDGRFLHSGLPNLFAIDVPAETSVLLLEARSPTPLELYLYDCSSGECFSHNYTIPPATRQRLTVRHPAPGRWIAAINAAPMAAATDTFSLEQTIAREARRAPLGIDRLRTGALWSRVSSIEDLSSADALLFQIVDGRLERDASQQRWEVRDDFPQLPHSPVAAGSARIRLR